MHNIFTFKVNQEEIVIDLEDKEKVLAHSWYINNSGYVQSNSWVRKHHTILLHRLVLDLEKSDSPVDHINGVKTDNRKANLRLSSCSLNQFNKEKPASRIGYSNFKGVCWAKDRCKWKASIAFKYKSCHLLTSSSEIHCALAYNIAAKLLAKEHAFLNKIPLVSAEVFNYVESNVILQLKRNKLL